MHASNPPTVESRSFWSRRWPALLALGAGLTVSLLAMFIAYHKEPRRSIYLPVARNNLAPELEIFDVANPEMVSGDRPLTTVPTQALYLLAARRRSSGRRETP